jgi:GNAT superfamily N-acetyltransferase
MIRDATPEDEFAIAKVHLEARSAGYGDLLDAAYTASLTLEGYVDDWRKRLAETHRRTLVGEVDGEVRGFTRFGDAPNARRPAERAGVLELIYVLLAYWGTGLGAALLAAAEEGLVTQGFTSAFLAVYEENRRARAFYDRHGWTHDGVSWQLDRGSPVTQVRYVKTL